MLQRSKEVRMKTAQWTLGLAGVVLMSLALACEQENSPTAPARGKSAALSAGAEWGLSESAEPAFTTIDVPGAIFTESNDIGPTDDIVGRYGSSDGKSHGYLLHEGMFTTIDFSPTFTSAIGINPSGDIVGRYQTADRTFHGFLLSAAGTFTSLDVPGATATSAFGINPRGDIVGGYCSPGPCPAAVQTGLNHGFLLRDGTYSSIDFPGALLTQAWKINAAGEVAGRYKSPDGRWHAFLMSDGAFTSIDVPGAIQTVSFPPQVGMNAAGDVVGSYCAAEPCPLLVTDNFVSVHGFLRSWEDRDNAGQVTTIDFPGASGGGAFGINTRGDIVGAYFDASHRTHGFLRSRGDALLPVTGTFILTFEPVSVWQADGNTVTDFTFHEQISGSIAGMRVGTGTLVVHPDGTVTADDAGVFTGTVDGVPGSVIIAVRAEGTFASLTAIATFDGSSGTGGLRGLRGTVRVTGAATGPTTLAGSYEGQVHFQAMATEDD
jgi:uncharacterized membrane protein